jgi:PAS domain S-box-containing protein
VEDHALVRPSGVPAVADALFAHAPVGLAVWDRDLRYVRINDELAAVNGAPAHAHLGRTVAEMLPRLHPALSEILGRVIAEGQPVRDVEVAGETPAARGVERVWRASYLPVHAPGDGVVAVVGVVIEVTEQLRAERAQVFLAEIGRRLVATLDLDETLKTVAALAVPELADWASVDLVDKNSGGTVNAATHPSPAEDPRGGGVDDRASWVTEARERVIRTGHVEVVRPPDEGGCAIVAPMRAHGETLGALTLRSARSDVLAGREVDLVATVADRCGLAIGNAQLAPCRALCYRSHCPRSPASKSGFATGRRAAMSAATSTTSSRTETAISCSSATWAARGLPLPG